MLLLRGIPALALLVLCTACTAGTTLTQTSSGAAPFAIGTLPDDSSAARGVAALELLDGVDYDAVGDGTSSAGTSLELDAAGLPFSWARYVFTLPAASQLNSLDVDVATPSGEFWVALSDYGETGAWEWHGPYIADTQLPFGADYARYLSPARNLYWVVLTAAGEVAVVDACSVDYTESSVSLEIPPSGTQTVDTGVCRNPSLALVPLGGEPGPRAPVIAYTQLAGAPEGDKLYLAYYSGGSWVTQPVLPEHNFTMPQLRWLDGDAAAVLCVYNQSLNKLVELRFDSGWQLSGAADIAPSPGLPFFRSALDVDPLTGELGLAHSYVDAAAGKLLYSYTDGGVWNTMAAVHDGDAVGGLTFRFDPAGGDPWLLFSHGTLDTTEMPHADFNLEMGRLSGGGWTITPVAFDDPDGHSSPLGLDLGFNGAGDPQLAMAALRDWQSFIPGFTFTGSLLLDGVVGSYTTDWAWDKVFTAGLEWSTIGWPIPSAIEFFLDECGEMRWAQPNELSLSEVDGSITFDLSLNPTGGSFTNANLYKQFDGADWNDFAYFTGTAGRGFDWAQDLSPVCAYIESETVDYQKVLAGDWEPTGTVLYWSPAS